MGQVGKANDEETEPRIAGEQIEEMAQTEVNVLMIIELEVLTTVCPPKLFPPRVPPNN